MAIDRPVAVITGASAGIGAAAVQVFAEAGYAVALLARRMDRLEAVAADVSRTCPGATLLPVLCDVASDDSVNAAFAQITARFGRVDALINNAGYGVYGSVETTALNDFRANMETNYFGVIRCTQAALPFLRKAAGARRWSAAIVNVSSILGRLPMPAMGSYVATKYALEALSETLRVEVHDAGILVSVVNPGVTQTDFGASAQGKRPENFIEAKSGMSARDVAKVILRAARRQKRNAYLTASGKAGVFVHWLAPSVIDWILIRVWRKTSAHKP